MMLLRQGSAAQESGTFPVLIPDAGTHFTYEPGPIWLRVLNPLLPFT
jgi:hypothetical protein